MADPNPRFIPFADESVALKIGDLNLENRVDRVSLFGSLDITRDKAGLRRVLELKARIDHIAAALQGENLPESVQTVPPGEVANPFKP